jgi:hypothetical protein
MWLAHGVTVLAFASYTYFLLAISGLMRHISVVALLPASGSHHDGEEHGDQHSTKPPTLRRELWWRVTAIEAGMFARSRSKK